MPAGAPDPNQPLPGEPPISSGENGVPKFTFFIYDHLGNSRILYSNVLKDCLQDSTKYILEHVLDYYPYGKTLREYTFVRERHQTTYHERDEETGLDYRGARFYDAEVGRFLSCDPLAVKYVQWGTYSYTLDNPVIFIDPEGKDVIITITAKPVGTTQMRLIGSTGRLKGITPETVEVPLYLLTVTDDVTGTVSEYHVTRDAPVINFDKPFIDPAEIYLETGELVNGTLINVNNIAFEPTTAIAYLQGYPTQIPKGSGIEAYSIRNLDGTDVLIADPGRGQKTANEVALHVGGQYSYDGKTAVTGSKACFTFAGKDAGNAGVARFLQM